MQFFKKSLIFIAVNILAFIVLDNILVFPSGYEMRMEEFKEGSYDSVILGHSWTRDGLDPFALAQSDENNVFNLSQGGIEVNQLQYILKELEDSNQIRCIYLDLCPSYWNKNGDINRDTPEPGKILNCLSGLNRMDYIVHELASIDLSRMIFNHEITKNTPEIVHDVIQYKWKPDYKDRIPEILNDHASDKEGKYLGHGYNYVTSEYRDENVQYQQYSISDISPDTLHAFEKLTEYCRNSDIQIIGVANALPASRLEHENWNVVHDFFQQLCDKNGVDFYDMNYVKWDLLPREKTDYSDNDGHMRGPLAERQSSLLRDIMLSQDPDSYFEPSYQAVLDGIRIPSAQ